MSRILTKPRVLIIDDDELIAVSLCQWLAAKGCACDVATEAHRASELIGDRQYDAILVDPYLTGGLAGGLEWIREAQPAATLIVATAYATPALREMSRHGGIQLIEKPQSVPFIGELIARAIGRTDEIESREIRKGERR